MFIKWRSSICLSVENTTLTIHPVHHKLSACETDNSKHIHDGDASHTNTNSLVHKIFTQTLTHSSYIQRSTFQAQIQVENSP